MKRTNYLGPSAAPRGRNSSHSRSHTPAPLPKAPLPFNLPSLRREAGGDGAGGGIAGAGAKWASPRAEHLGQQPDVLKNDARNTDAQGHADGAPAHSQAPRAWGGAGLRAVRPPPDFPHLGNRAMPRSPFAPSPDNPPANSMTTLTPSPAVDRQRAKTSTDDVRALTRSLNPVLNDSRRGAASGDVRASSQAGMASTSRLTANSGPHLDGMKKLVPAGSASSASVSQTIISATDDDDWAQDDDAMDFSDPIALPEVPDLSPVPASPPPQVVLSVPRSPAQSFPRPFQVAQSPGRPSAHQPPAAHWAHAIRLQQEDEQRLQDGRNSSGLSGQLPSQGGGFSNYEPAEVFASVPSPPSPPKTSVNLAVIKDQKTIMRTKAEVAQEARRKAEEERLRQQRERAATKLRELEERMKRSPVLHAEQQSDIQPSSSRSQLGVQNRMGVDGESSMKTTSEDRVQTPLSSEHVASPRLVLQRIREEPREDPVGSPRDVTARGIPGERLVVQANPGRRGRNSEQSNRGQEAIDRLTERELRRRPQLRGRNYDGSTTSETREQWIDRRRSETEGRDVARQVIDICINRAVYGQAPRMIRSSAPRGAKLIPTNHGRRDLPAKIQPPRSGSGTPGLAMMGSVKVPSSQVRADLVQTRREVPARTVNQREGTNVSATRESALRRDAPVPLRPAPWAKLQTFSSEQAHDRGVPVAPEQFSRSGGVGPAAGGQQAGQGHRLQSQEPVQDPTPRESVLADKPSRAFSHKRSGHFSTGRSTTGYTGPNRVRPTSSNSNSARESVLRREDAVTIIPPLGGNVKVLMNPHTKRETLRSSADSSGQTSSNSMLSDDIQMDGPHDSSRGEAARHRSERAGTGTRVVREIYKKSEGSDERQYTRGQQKLAKQAGSSHYGGKPSMQPVQRVGGDESAAWTRPAPSTPSFDAITRAFSNQPAAFPLVGTPLFPPVPVVEVITAPTAGASGGFNAKSDVWSTKDTWTGNSSAPAVESEWWPGQASESKQDARVRQSSGVNDLSTAAPLSAGRQYRAHESGSDSIATLPLMQKIPPVGSSQNVAKHEGNSKTKRRSVRGSKKVKKADKSVKPVPDVSIASVKVSDTSLPSSEPGPSAGPRSSTNRKVRTHAKSSRTAVEHVKKAPRRVSDDALQTEKRPDESLPGSSFTVNDQQNEETPQNAEGPGSNVKDSAKQSERVPPRTRSRRSFGRGKKRTDHSTANADMKHFITREGIIVEVSPEEESRHRNGERPTVKFTSATSESTDEANRAPSKTDETFDKETVSGIRRVDENVNTEAIPGEMQAEVAKQNPQQVDEVKIGDTTPVDSAAEQGEKSTSFDKTSTFRGRGGRRGKSLRGRGARGGRGRGGRGSRGKGRGSPIVETGRSAASSSSTTEPVVAKAVTSNPDD